MTRQQALTILLDIATGYGENAEEGFTRRILATDSDEACAELADRDGYDADDVIEISDLWQAAELINAEIATTAEGARQ